VPPTLNVNVRGRDPLTKQALRVRAAKVGMSLEAFAREARRRAAETDPTDQTHPVTVAQAEFGPNKGEELLDPWPLE